MEFNPNDAAPLDIELVEDGPTRLRPRLTQRSHREGDVYEDTSRY